MLLIGKAIFLRWSTHVLLLPLADISGCLPAVDFYISMCICTRDDILWGTLLVLGKARACVRFLFVTMFGNPGADMNPTICELLLLRGRFG